MNKLILIFGFVVAANLISNISYAASFVGSWSGQGQSIMRPGSANSHIRSCASIIFNLDQSATQFQLSGQYTCQDLTATYDPSIFDIKNGEIFYEKSRVGTLTDTGFEISYVDPDDGSTFTLRLDLTLSGLEYNEEWRQDGAVQMSVKGLLKH